MKLYDVCGLGNALVDILVNISESELNDRKLEKSTMRLVEQEEQKNLLNCFEGRDLALVSGGSVANSVIALAQLGGRAAFISSIGDDRYGLFYKSEFDSLGIDFISDPVVGGMTGTCLSMVTPDAERTMRTCLAVSNNLSAKYVTEKALAQSKWLFVEGYLFANPANGQGAIKEAIKLAKRNDCKVAVTVSEAWVYNSFTDAVNEAISQADLVFANESEAEALTKSVGGENAFNAMTKMVPNVVVTCGPKGAYVSYAGSKFHVEAFPCTPRDLTGAGDMFAGAFLYGITNNIDPRIVARCSCYLAREVITRMGARLHTGTKQYWENCRNQELQNTLSQ